MGVIENKNMEISSTIFPSNLTVPPMMPDRVIRYRLLKRLDKGTRRKLTLVLAPAGFGKTTLIASWLHTLSEAKQTAFRTAWLSLDDKDNDPIGFLNHLIASLCAIDMVIGRSARPFLKTPHLPKLDYMMRLILDDLAATPDQSLVVLDDFHAIKCPKLHRALEFFLSHLPPQCRLMLLTREEPSLSLTDLRRQAEVAEIRLKDLRFSSEETKAFLNRTMGLEVTTETAQRLGDRTEGWVAGLQMAALSLRRRSASLGPRNKAWEVDPAGDGHRYIIDYLAREALKQQSPEVQAFLHQTAILDSLNASLCDAVTERSDSQAMLTALEKANLFLIPLDRERQWYRYHRLFADFLRAGAAEAEQHILHERASRWHEAQGMITEALKHSLAAGDPKNAVRLIREYSVDKVRNGEFAMIRGWILALPDEIVRQHSDMAVCRGWAYCSCGELSAAESYVQIALKIGRPEDPPAQHGKLLCLRSFLALSRGDSAGAEKFAREAIDLLGDPEETFHCIMALTYMGQAQSLSGDRESAIQTLRQTAVLGQRSGNHLIAMEALASLTTLLYQQGCLREALLMCEQAANRYLDANGDPLPVAGLVCVSLGVLYYEINDLDRAYNYLTTGLDLCSHMGILGKALVGQCTLAKLFYARGETEDMREALALARRLAARCENQRRNQYVDVVTADLQLLQGQLAAAALSLASLPMSESDRTPEENLTYARWLLAHSKVDEAQGLLSRLQTVVDRQGRRCSQISVHLLQAVAHKLRGSFTEALDCLKAAVRLGGPEGYYRLFLDEGPAIADMLPDCQSIAPAFVDGLLNEFAKSFSSDDSNAAASPPISMRNQEAPLIDPLTKTQLEVLRLMSGGLSNRDIANKLSVTEGTVKWHLNHIYNKLSVSSRTQAIVEARKHHLL